MHVIDGESGRRRAGADPQRVVTLAFVSSVNAASIRAVRYAMSLDASETRAIHFQLDAEDSRDRAALVRREPDDPLDIVEAPFRDLSEPILEEVRRFTSRPDTVVNVVIPELIVRRPWHLLLHNQTALFIKRLLLFEERAILTSVPFSLGSGTRLIRWGARPGRAGPRAHRRPLGHRQRDAFGGRPERLIARHPRRDDVHARLLPQRRT